MTTIAERFRVVAAGFTARVEGAPADRWSSPAPCEGWVARDVVDHLASFIPPVLSDIPGVDAPAAPPASKDPVATWAHCRDQVQGCLDDPEIAGTTFISSFFGEQRVETAIELFILGDVLVHTWDLARATGQDETLDEEEARRLYERMEPMADGLAQSGHFSPRTPVADDAPYGQKVIALSGRIL